MLSYLFFAIAVTAQIVDVLFSSSQYFYTHYLQLTLLLIAVSPLIGIILGILGKWGNHKVIAIGLNLIFFISISLLATLNFLIMTFGK